MTASKHIGRTACPVVPGSKGQRASHGRQGPCEDMVPPAHREWPGAERTGAAEHAGRAGPFPASARPSVSEKQGVREFP